MSQGGRPRAPLKVAAGAAALYGSWAIVYNWSYGVWVAWRAGVAQVALSFLSTYFFVHFATRMYRLGRSPRQGLALSVVSTLALMFGVMFSVHSALGTPAVLPTIAPSMLLGGTLMVVYISTLFVAARAA
jgi:hypothetical protein